MSVYVREVSPKETSDLTSIKNDINTSSLSLSTSESTLDTVLVETFENYTLSTTGWVDNTYSLDADYPSDTYDILVSSGAWSAEEYDAFVKAKIIANAQNILTALGEIPQIDVPLILKLTHKVEGQQMALELQHITSPSGDIGELETQVDGLLSQATSIETTVEELSQSVRYVNYTLLAQNQRMDMYNLGDEYPQSDYNIELYVGNVSDSQYEAYAAAKMVGDTMTNTLIALGTVPEIDIPVILRVTKIKGTGPWPDTPEPDPEPEPEPEPTPPVLDGVYGIKWNNSDPVHTVERVGDAVGLKATATLGSTVGTSDFDQISPWKDIRLATSTEAKNNQQFVFIPSFYWGFSVDGDDSYLYVSNHEATVTIGETKQLTLTKHPHDTDTSSYIGRYPVDSTCLTYTGATPYDTTQKTVAMVDSELIGNPIGNPQTVVTWPIYSAVIMLAMIEFGTLNLPGSIGKGNISNSAPNVNGLCDSIKTGTEANDGTHSVTYRYIENLWGNTYEMIRGLAPAGSVGGGSIFFSYTPSIWSMDASTAQITGTGIFYGDGEKYFKGITAMNGIAYGSGVSDDSTDAIARWYEPIRTYTDEIVIGGTFLSGNNIIASPLSMEYGGEWTMAGGAVTSVRACASLGAAGQELENVINNTFDHGGGNSSFEVPDFGTGDFEQIKEAITLAREGKINIYKRWKVGDTRIVMWDTNFYDLVLLNKSGYNYADLDGECLFVVGFKQVLFSSSLDSGRYESTSLCANINGRIDPFWETTEQWGDLFPEFTFYLWPFGQGDLVDPYELRCKYTLPDIGNIDYEANKGYPDTKSNYFPFFEYYWNPDNRSKTDFMGLGLDAEYWTSGRNHAVAAQIQYKSVDRYGKESAKINTSSLWVSPIMVI